LQRKKYPQKKTFGLGSQIPGLTLLISDFQSQREDVFTHPSQNGS